MAHIILSAASKVGVLGLVVLTLAGCSATYRCGQSFKADLAGVPASPGAAEDATAGALGGLAYLGCVAREAVTGPPRTPGLP